LGCKAQIRRPGAEVRRYAQELVMTFGAALGSLCFAAHADVISGPKAYVVDALAVAPALFGVTIVVGIAVWIAWRRRKR
jgi:hypothetical protein